jgi:hypothetical protein
MKAAGRVNGMAGTKAAQESLTPACLAAGPQIDAATATRPAVDPTDRGGPSTDADQPGRPVQEPWSGPGTETAAVTPPATVALAARLLAACLLLVGVGQTALSSHG